MRKLNLAILCLMLLSVGVQAETIFDSILGALRLKDVTTAAEAGAIPAPTSPSENDVLTWDGEAWVAKDSLTLSGDATANTFHGDLDAADVQTDTLTASGAVTADSFVGQSATYDADDDGAIDPAAGGTGIDSSSLSGPAYIIAGVWTILDSATGAAGQVPSLQADGTMTWTTAGGSGSVTSTAWDGSNWTSDDIALSQSAVQGALITSPTLQTGTTYTLQASDAGKIVTLTNAADVTLTVPTGLTAYNRSILVRQGGAGGVTVTGASGVTIDSPAPTTLESQYETGELLPVGDNRWQWLFRSGAVVGGAPFGDDPSALDGVSFVEGTATVGMAVWKTPGTYAITAQNTAEIDAILVVAGGGSGGVGHGGGGGAGGVLLSSGSMVAGGKSIAVVVGSGGTAGAASNSSANGVQGGNSQFGCVWALGGGRGGLVFGPGGNGGSGGGGSRGVAGGSGVSVPLQGYTGGAGADSSPWLGGGGGGASENAKGANGIDGGDGVTHWGFAYGGGGGGGSEGGTAGVGGAGGGGAGRNSAATAAVSGTANTGGGGGGSGTGGGATTYGESGAGGHGIVIVRWGGYDKHYDPTTDTVTDP